jgi:hypothetical protein
LPQIYYVLYQESEWTHNPYIINAVPSIIDMCGGLTYTIDAGDFSVYIEYNVELNIIVIFCDDFSVLPVGSFDYTITASLSIYVEVNVFTTGTIICVDPCTSAVLYAATPSNIIYHYDGEVIFSFPTLTVNPVACSSQVLYTCTYMQGPYTGTVNMCGFEMSIGGDTCYAQFNVQTGQYTFNCFNMAVFPPGTYQFTITAYIGAVQTSIVFTMTLVSPCNNDVTPVITNDPLYLVQGYDYTIRDTAIELTWDPATIGNLVPDPICGDPTIQIINNAGSANLAAVFQPNYVANKLTIYTMDHTMHGQYRLRFKYFNEYLPSVFAMSNSFLVTVVDACRPPQ